MNKKEVEIKDGRGLDRINLGKNNRTAIIQWFKKNKEGTSVDCAKETGLSYKTVLNHVKEIKKS